MHNYKALKSASKVSVRKQKVVDRAAESEVHDDDGKVVRHAQAEESHEELQVVCKCYDAQTGEAKDDSVRAYSLSDVKHEVDRCKSDVASIQEQQAEWEQLEKDLKAL
jgi:hypothetical protein|tara:strand:- start:42 stop:365 length:324 start_codon:yes stop_codon:yes gene_type:complete